MIGFAMFSASSPFANITTPDFLAGSAITKALKTPLSPQCQRMTLFQERSIPLDLMIIMDRPQYHEEGIIFITHH
jgi:hypothetical protein